MRTIQALGIAAAFLGECGDAGLDQSGLPPANRVALRYAPELRVRLEEMEPRTTGLYVQDVVAGEGMRADSGDVATVHYTGWLSSGVEFDTSRDGRPLEIALGSRGGTLQVESAVLRLTRG